MQRRGGIQHDAPRWDSARLQNMASNERSKHDETPTTGDRHPNRRHQTMQQQRRARPSRAMSGFKHWITQRRLDFLPPRPPQSITSTQIIESITAPATPDILQQMSKMVQEFKVFFALTYFAWAESRHDSKRGVACMTFCKVREELGQ